MGDPAAPLADNDLQIFKDSIANLRPLTFTNIHRFKKEIS